MADPGEIHEKHRVLSERVAALEAAIKKFIEGQRAPALQKVPAAAPIASDPLAGHFPDDKEPVLHKAPAKGEVK